MVEKNRQILVRNRENAVVGYTVPDLGNLHRNFMPREQKTVTFEELEKLSYLPGGDDILRNCLVIKDEEAVEELLNGVEPQYFYDEKDIVRLLNQGSLDEFLDCLDFAPDGVLDMVKDFAVRLPLNDVAKRKAIYDKLNFDVTRAIQMIEDSKNEDEKPAAGVMIRRTSAPQKKVETPARRRVVVSSEKNG